LNASYLHVCIGGDEEFTNHISEFPPSQTHQFFDDDQLSAKVSESCSLSISEPRHVDTFYRQSHLLYFQTSSSHTSSSVFKDFLRRSSKKYKKEKPPKTSTVLGFGKKGVDGWQSQESNRKSKPGDIYLQMEPKFSSKRHDATTAISSDSSLPAPRPNPVTSVVPNNTKTTTTATHFLPSSSSPFSLSFVPSELNLAENSRNRKPIYINQEKQGTQDGM